MLACLDALKCSGSVQIKSEPMTALAYFEQDHPSCGSLVHSQHEECGSLPTQVSKKASLHMPFDWVRNAAAWFAAMPMMCPCTCKHQEGVMYHRNFQVWVDQMVDRTAWVVAAGG